MLLAGTKLGPYEILAPLGAGGMGEVYRAFDARLGREVAIKILPAEYSENTDRLRRFEQEARAAGMLNHPNIMAIYDIGTHNGCTYVVSELLEGETLRDRLAGTTLPVRKTIDFALQVISGIAAAHDKGIVHRDLKPENIFITRDGRVKILDFGLAKLIPSHTEDEKATSLPTATTPVQTESGIVLGTVGYMSPEQVRGKTTDHRSDVFSFGTILFEMVSGRRPFERDSAVETMNAILKEDPPELSDTTRTIPTELLRIIRHCLEKSAEERFQSFRDLAFHLQSVSGASSQTAISSTAPSPLGRKHLKLGLSAFAVIVLFLLTFILGKKMGVEEGQKAPGRNVSSISTPKFHRLTFRRGSIRSARFAPDGQTVLYSAAWEANPAEVFATIPQSPESRSLGLPKFDILSISSTGQLALSRDLHNTLGLEVIGTLAQAPFSGGSPRELLENVASADWSADGAQLAVVRVMNGEYRLEFPVGNILYKSGGWISHPRISPTGDRIAFIDHPVRGDDRGSVQIVDLKKTVTSLSGEWFSVEGLAWFPSGKEIGFTASDVGSSNSLYAVDLEGKSRVIVRVAGRLTLQDISRQTQFLMTRDEVRGGFYFFSSEEKEPRDLSWLDGSYVSDISKDAKTVVFLEGWEGGGKNYGIYLRKSDGSPAVRLGDGAWGALSPDEKLVLAVVLAPPSQLILLPTGPGEPKKLPRGEVSIFQFVSWLPDGRRILFAGSPPQKSLRLYRQDLASGDPVAITEEGVTLANANPVSPDGKWVTAVSSDERVAVYPIEGGSPRILSSLGPEDKPVRWSDDGKYLYISRIRGAAATLYRMDLKTERLELWKEIRLPDPIGILALHYLVMTADGKAIAAQYLRGFSDLYLVDAPN